MGQFMTFILGVAIGAVALIAKNKYLGNETTQKLASTQRKLDNVLYENSRLMECNMDLERKEQDLVNENNKLSRECEKNRDSLDDVNDKLRTAQEEANRYRLQCNDMTIRLKEYEVTCENYEAEISRLKQKG